MRLLALLLNGLTAAWHRHSMTHFLGGLSRMGESWDPRNGVKKNDRGPRKGLYSHGLVA